MATEVDLVAYAMEHAPDFLLPPDQVGKITVIDSGEHDDGAGVVVYAHDGKTWQITLYDVTESYK